ncbi:MAG TPA: hypothetical protein VGE69_04450 [Pseudomonadales bacterium]
MPAHAQRIAFMPLLLLAAQAGAQTLPLPTERAVAAAQEQQVSLNGPAANWPKAPSDGTQTSFTIRHDASDGTVVGMNLQQSRYPSLLLRVEVVPPGYGPAVETDNQHSPAAPVIDQNLRTVHKVSLRYRF